MIRQKIFSRWLLVTLLVWCMLPNITQADPLSITADATLNFDGTRISGEIRLVLHSSRPIYHVQIIGQDQTTAYELATWPFWDPNTEKKLSVNLPTTHLAAGQYHLLLSVPFQDVSGYWTAVSLAIPYGVNTTPPHPKTIPTLTVHGGDLIWDTAGLPTDSISATFSRTPWHLSPTTALTPNDDHLQLIAEPNRRYPTNTDMTLLARMDWLEGGSHHSHIFDWKITTDGSGQWVPQPGATIFSPMDAIPWIFRLLALLFAFMAIWVRVPDQKWEPWMIGGGILGLTLWPLFYLSPGLWMLSTWPTGGDLASHAYYAHVFTEMVAQGRISGWLPEVFAGFPAFIHYFPLPFLLVTALSALLDEPVALKWIAMIPALLLPLSCYGMGMLLNWSPAARLLAAAGTTGFLVNTGNTIWGGNFLSQLSGEFANSWGFLFVPLFLGSLHQLLASSLSNTAPWRRWVLVTTLLTLAIAMSHGTAWLMALVGGLLMAGSQKNPAKGVATVLTIHLAAAMMAGIWLLPFLSTSAWTIPNDGASPIVFDDLWPESLWPFGLALFFFRLIPGLSAPLSLIIAGITGTVLAPWMGLADIRFIPYAQWGLAVLGGAMAGTWLSNHSRRSLGLSLGILAVLISWWSTQMTQINVWSQWNMAGYQSKALSPEYQQLAHTLANPLSSPRVAVEHHPFNDDVGSTRAMEALPLFGSGPVLEGLYMEASITGPFIYQIQSEISRFPSSPLVRFPSMGGNLQQTINHLREFYTDTIVLRSPEMQKRFSQDSRFVNTGRIGPFEVLKLSNMNAKLVEPITTPLGTAARKDWMVTAFQRFILNHPYVERMVFLKDQQTLPLNTPPPHCSNAQVTIETMERETLIFTTDQPGCPHLIRMAYHDFWQVSSGGTGKESVYLVEPAFMMVIPVQERVTLRFDAGIILVWGKALTVMGLALFVFLVRRKRWIWWIGATVQAPMEGLRRKTVLLLSWLGLLVVLAMESPEANYLAAHRLITEGHPMEAARLFDKTWPRRKGWAKQAEGLFWGSRAWELAGQGLTGVPGYRQLLDQFPASYWAPESLYRLAKQAQSAGDTTAYHSYRQQLIQRHPGSHWTMME
ncbi:MAG: 6-pyruvoyl-tetrahydropterin synthase-related protein [Magnetococcus sp. THC-1_WYH]